MGRPVVPLRLLGRAVALAVSPGPLCIDLHTFRSMTIARKAFAAINKSLLEKNRAFLAGLSATVFVKMNEIDHPQNSYGRPWDSLKELDERAPQAIFRD